MKTFSLDPDGALAVVETDDEGGVTSWHISPAQLERHAPMFEPSMKAAERVAFRAAIDAQRATPAVKAGE